MSPMCKDYFSVSLSVVRPPGTDTEQGPGSLSQCKLTMYLLCIDTHLSFGNVEKEKRCYFFSALVLGSCVCI